MLPKFIKIDSYSVLGSMSLDDLVDKILSEYPDYEIVGTMGIKQQVKFKFASCFLRRKDLSPADKTYIEIIK